MRVNPPDDGETYRDLCYRENTVRDLTEKTKNQIIDALLNKRDYVWLLNSHQKYTKLSKAQIKYMVVDYLSSREVLNCILYLAEMTTEKPDTNNLLGWINETSERTANYLFNRDH